MKSLRPSMLDHASLEAMIPHRGAMCLLDRMTAWDETRIACVAINHRDPAHPLRTRSGLLAGAAIEYAAQAAALHGALIAQATGGKALAGHLASARDVRLAAWRLDDLPSAAIDELQISAERQAGDATRLLYAFSVVHAGREIAAGRLAVILNTADPS